MAYIKSINVNLFDGKFNTILYFKPHLNILSGVNGTGKTKVLWLLKQGQGILVEPSYKPIKSIALSPKRNAEKKAQQALLNSLRATNISSKTQELLSKQIQDNTYDSYPSFAELFCLHFERMRYIHSKKSQQQILDEMIGDINKEVVDLILPDYKLEASLNHQALSIELKIYKGVSSSYINLEDLSTGEQELLSLSFNIYLTKDEVDVFLIDEPEIHLNWTVERNLFDFLKKFSEKYNKQIIVSTHSRIIFNQEFQPLVTYLVWEKGRLKTKKEVPKDYKEKIAGEYAIFNLLPLSKRTIFVEDNEHEKTLQFLMQMYGKDINSVEILKLSGGSGILDNFYKVVYQNKKLPSTWLNAWFLQDGDNQESDSQPNFIKLEKYSIESYYMNFEVLSSLLQKSIQEVKEVIGRSILKNKQKIIGKNKNAEFFSKLMDNLDFREIEQEWLDFIDCSQFIDDFVKEIGYKKFAFMKKYIEEANKIGKIEEIFDRKLINFIKNL